MPAQYQALRPQPGLVDPHGEVQGLLQPGTGQVVLAPVEMGLADQPQGLPLPDGVAAAS